MKIVMEVPIITNDEQEWTLIYTMTQTGDPDPAKGEFGNNDCMGGVRKRAFNAVIGVGGTGDDPRCNGIARKLIWVGIGPHRRETRRRHPHRCGAKLCSPHKRGTKWRGPLVTFDHFLYYGQDGPLLKEQAPSLAEHMYDKRAKVIMLPLSGKERQKERQEVGKILHTAKKNNSH